MASSENVSWILRHVGPPPTIKGIVEVVELKQGTTTFGRGAGVDVYIDSQVLRNFISRHHAVIKGEKTLDGQLQFTLHNQGLNGTYVNDIRIGKERRLLEGDRVIFGHTNGYKVKVGETAIQPNSEFQFVLECILPGKTIVAPLQEHKQQKGGVPGSEHIPPPAVYTPRWNGQSVSTDSDHNRVGLVRQRSVSAKASPLQSSKDAGRSGSPKDDSVNSLGNDRISPGKTPPVGQGSNQNVSVVCTAKEDITKQKVCDRSELSSSPLRLSDGLKPREQSESSLNCEQKAAKEKENLSQKLKTVSAHQRTSSTNSARSDSPKTEVRPKRKTVSADQRTLSTSSGSSDSSKGDHRSTSAVMNNQQQERLGPRDKRKSTSVRRGEEAGSYRSNSSERRKKNAWSPRHQKRSKATVGGDTGYRSRSPLVLVGTEVTSRSKRNGHSEVKRSKSPISLLPNTKDSKKKSPSLKLLRKSMSPRSRNSKSKSPNPKAGRSSRSSSESSQSSSSNSQKSVYDEPPVLSPELDYVKTPSSNARSPSPCIPIYKTSDSECDEIDDVDRDYRVPPTPGRGLHDLSPAPHFRQDTFPQSKVQDVSPQVKKWLLGEHTENSGDGEVLTGEKGNPLTLTKKDSDFVHITAFSNKSQDKDKTKGGENAHSSRTQRLEADSTTAVLFRDNISGLGMNSRHSRSKRDDGDERTIRKEEKTRNADKDRTDGKHRQQTCEKVGKDGALKSVLGSSKGDSRSGSEKANRLHIDSSRSSSKSPNHQVGKSPTHRNGKGSSPHKTRDSRSGSGDSGSSVKSHPDRNVFEHFWAERQRKPDAVVSGKRRHRSTASEASGDDGFSRTVTKLAKADSAKNRSCQESGLSAKPDSSGKQSDSGSRSSDNCANDRKLLGDAHVSMHKVTLAKTNMRKDKGNKETLSGPAADGRGSNNSKSKDSDKHASSKCKTTFKTITKRANDDDEESLFGRQLKSLGTMQPRERLKKPKHSSESKEIPIAYIKGPGDTLGKRPKDLKSRQAETPHQESRGVDRDTGGKNKSSDSRTGQRQSSSKSRSQTPDRVISGDGDELARSRSMRKVAMRRPPLIKDRSVSQDSGRSSERKLGPGQPNKRSRRKKSKKKSSDDEDDDMDDDFNDEKEKDEDLPEGVTWYEEENCASSHCCRPADKRVQWVCCDDCDKWYHTVCVGIAAFEELKDEDFHCGCV